MCYNVSITRCCFLKNTGKEQAMHSCSKYFTKLFICFAMIASFCKCFVFAYDADSIVQEEVGIVFENGNIMEQRVFDALKWIVGILEKHNVEYVLSGGLGAQFYGSSRPLNDIDFDIPESAFDVIIDDIRDYLVFGPIHYKDFQWDTKFIRLDFHSVGIDFGGAYDTKLYDAEKKEWVHSPVDFSRKREFKVNELKIDVMDPYELIEYKKILARDCDKKDVEAMEAFLADFGED